MNWPNYVTLLYDGFAVPQRLRNAFYNRLSKLQHNTKLQWPLWIPYLNHANKHVPLSYISSFSTYRPHIHERVYLRSGNLASLMTLPIVAKKYENSFDIFYSTHEHGVYLSSIYIWTISQIFLSNVQHYIWEHFWQGAWKEACVLSLGIWIYQHLYQKK